MSYQVRVRENDLFKGFIAEIFLDGEYLPACGGSGATEAEAIENAEAYYQKLQKAQDEHTTRQPTEVDSVYSDIREQEKVMAGLIEKAKREGLDGRLIAMANTDFERGFMALEKAINTNKG